MDTRCSSLIGMRAWHSCPNTTLPFKYKFSTSNTTFLITVNSCPNVHLAREYDTYEKVIIITCNVAELSI